MSADYRAIRDAFHIRRYHSVSLMLKSDMVGEHTANVIGILFYIYNDDPPVKLILAALHHDVPEIVSGDIPAPIKWSHKALAAAVKDIEVQCIKSMGLAVPENLGQAQILKFADMLELCFKAVEEMALGNDSFHQMLDRGLEFCINMLHGPLALNVRAHEIFKVMTENPFMEVNIEEGGNEETNSSTDPNARQVGGEHYTKQRVQHWDYVLANNIPYMEAQIIKYVSRWRDKDGLQDLHKAQHFLEKLIDHQREDDGLEPTRNYVNQG